MRGRIELGKIKVLHIAQSNGGVAEYLKMFFKHIDKSTFQLDLLCSKQYKAEEKYFDKLGYTITLIDMERDICLLKDFNTMLKTVAYIKKSKPEIIHLHSSKAGALGRMAYVLGRLTFQFKRITIIYNPHGWAFDMDTSSIKKFLYKTIEKICAIFTDKIVVISEYEKRCALSCKICKSDKIKVIYNGIDLNKYSQSYDKVKELNKLSIPSNSFIIGMVGRLTSQKSPYTFVSIANEIKKMYKDAYFILVGDGELKEETEKLIRKNKLEKSFLITGWTEDVPRYVSLFDIALLTSKWEGFGLVLAEYMVMSKPIVASRVGGVLDIIKDGYNGMLADVDCVNEFVDKIIRIKTNEDIYKTLIINGHKYATEKLDIIRVVTEHEETYKYYIDYKRAIKFSNTNFGG